MQFINQVSVVFRDQCIIMWECTTWLVVLRTGNVTGRINEVTQRRTQLVLGWWLSVQAHHLDM